MNICQNLWPHLYRKLPKGFPQDMAYILNRVGRIFWQKKSRANGRHFQIGRQQNRQNFNVLRFQWKLISIFCFKRGPNRGEVYKRNMCINYFLISAHLSNSITSDNRDPNNALNSDMGVVWGLLCLHPNTIKLRYIMILTETLPEQYNKNLALKNSTNPNAKICRGKHHTRAILLFSISESQTCYCANSNMQFQLI
jgi:hypothetical protein